MTKIYLYLISLILCTFVTNLQAEVEEDGAFWINLNAQGKLHVENLNWYAEYQPRWRQEGKHLDVSILRPAISYAINQNTSIWLGYANVRFHPSGRSSREENRLWQQFLYKFEPIDNVFMQSRTRFEQRHFENASDTGYRLRQLFRVSVPLSASPYSLVLWDEYFIHVNDTDWGAVSGFDQNRAFLGVNAKINQQVALEVGYLNQYINTRNVDRENHALSTTLNLQF
jgi:hypothetical protein